MEVNRLCAENHYPWNFYDSLQRKFKTITSLFNRCSPVSQNLCALSPVDADMLNTFNEERPASSNDENLNWLNEKPKRIWPRFVHPNIDEFVSVKSVTKSINSLCDARIVNRICCDVNRYFLNQMESVNEANLNTIDVCPLSSITTSFISEKQNFRLICHISTCNLFQAIQLKCTGGFHAYLDKYSVPKTLSDLINMPVNKPGDEMNLIGAKLSQNECLVKYRNVCNCVGPYLRQPTQMFTYCEQFQTFKALSEKTPMNLIDRMNNNNNDLNCSSIFHENQRNISQIDKMLQESHTYCANVIPDIIMYMYLFEDKNEMVLSSLMTVKNKMPSNQKALDLMIETPNKSVSEQTICSHEADTFLDILVVLDSDADNSGCDELNFKDSPFSPLCPNFKRPVCENATIAFIIGAASDSEDVEMNDDDSDFDDWNESDESWQSLQPPLETSDSESECYRTEHTNFSIHSTPDLEEINKRWQTDVLKDNVRSPSSKKVSFAEDKALVETHRMVAWSYAYQAARIGPWETYARDRARFQKHIEEIEQSIGYIFSEQHRAHIINKFKDIAC